MKKFTLLIVTLLAIFFICSCNQEKNSIRFIPLSEKDFNYPADTSFAIPKGKIWEERKKLHDSCMGSSYAANAIFIRTKDTFNVGNIVNRKTMHVVKTLTREDFFTGPFTTALGVISMPCYEKRSIDVSIDSFLNNILPLKIDSASEEINRELSKAIENSIYTEVETGLWVNVELNDVFGKVLDTTSDAKELEYKKYLLDPDNMVLLRTSSVSEVSFYIHTSKPLSNSLQNILRQKPFATVENADNKSQLFLLTSNSFEITITGFFQIIGQFMRCELK